MLNLYELVNYKNEKLFNSPYKGRVYFNSLNIFFINKNYTNPNSKSNLKSLLKDDFRIYLGTGYMERHNLREVFGRKEYKSFINFIKSLTVL